MATNYDNGGVIVTVEGIEAGVTRPNRVGTGSPVSVFPLAVQSAINANGAINLTSYYTAMTSVASTGVTFTLASGTYRGQTKKIKLIVDGADATLTFNTNATIVFADVGDYVILVWSGTAWVPVELGNDADGATAPVYTPAS